MFGYLCLMVVQLVSLVNCGNYLEVLPEGVNSDWRRRLEAEYSGKRYIYLRIAGSALA